MTVRKLISLLKKMPQHLQVGMNHSDNSPWEIAGWPCNIDILDKEEEEVPDYIINDKMESYNDLPRKTVVIHC